MAATTPNLGRQLPRGSLYGLASAVLFGLSTPLSKVLLHSISPVMLAGLLYLGAALVLTVFKISSALLGRRSPEAPLQSSDIPVLGAIVVLGGILGPVLMLLGLTGISALTGSLLLNLEPIFTIALAVCLFREHLEWGGTAAAILVIAGALLSSWRSGPIGGHFLGVLAIAAACLCWAIDNNLSQRLSLRDPVVVVQIKAVGAGTTSVALAHVTGHALPTFGYMVDALALGGLSYGLSLICVMLALRDLGAARQSVWFSTAPFISAALSIPIFGLLPNSPEVVGAALMIAGIFMLTRERHLHPHTHEQIEHDHLHVHDDHHQHKHPHQVPEVHSHLHRHGPITHEHAHVSDFHHRHRHG